MLTEGLFEHVAGTLFVLQKDASPKERLLDAVTSNKADDQQIQQLVEQLQSCSPEKRPATSAKTQGKWKLLWSMQVLVLSWLHACLAFAHIMLSLTAATL